MAGCQSACGFRLPRRNWISYKDSTWAHARRFIYRDELKVASVIFAPNLMLFDRRVHSHISLNVGCLAIGQYNTIE